MQTATQNAKAGGNAPVGVKDLTQGGIAQQIVLFALPLLLSQIFQQLYNTADSFIVGHYLGTEALAAVSSSGTLINLFISFFSGTAIGGGVVISRYFGAGRHDLVQRAIHTMICSGLVCGALLSAAGVAFTPTVLGWMKTDPEVLPDAIEYFRYYFLGALATLMYNVCLGIMNAIGDSRRPLYYLIFSSLLNVVLDVLFVGGMGYGVWSAAVATVISQAASVVMCFLHLTRRDFAYRVKLSQLRIDRAVLGEILRCGLPSGLQNSVINFANVIVQSQINSFGTYAMAAYGTHAKVEGFGLLPITSFTMAITTFVSQNLGARQYDRAKKGAQFGIITCITMAELIGIATYIFAPQLISMFDSTAGVVELGVRQTRIVALFYFLLAYSHSIAAVCRGAGRAFVPMLIMLSVWCVFRIIYIYAVMHIFGELEYVYWAYPITWSISSVIYFIYYHRSDWVHGFDNVKTAK